MLYSFSRGQQYNITKYLRDDLSTSSDELKQLLVLCRNFFPWFNFFPHMEGERWGGGGWSPGNRGGRDTGGGRREGGKGDSKVVGTRKN